MIDSGELEHVSGHKLQQNVCTGLSGETTQITRNKSESQKSTGSQVGKMLDINIAKNYSFVHDSETVAEPQPNELKNCEKNKIKKAEYIGETVKKNVNFYELKEEGKLSKVDRLVLMNQNKIQNFFFENLKEKDKKESKEAGALNPAEKQYEKKMEEEGVYNNEKDKKAE